MNKTLSAYATLYEQKKVLEEEMEKLKEAIVGSFQKEGIDKMETERGNFTIGRRQSYTFTSAVTKIEEKLKIEKHKEIEKGKAKATETSYLIFKQPTETD